MIRLTFFEITKGNGTSTNLAWLLQFLSNIHPSNRIQLIQVGMVINGGPFEPGDCLAWTQLDRVLADTHFKFLEKLEFSTGITRDDDNAYHLPRDPQYRSACARMVAGFPLLVERGISVQAHTYFIVT
jgi:hypothetical protein